MINHLLRKCVITAALAGIGASGSAIADNVELGTMTVTATRTAEEIQKAPASTTVVNSMEIEKLHAPTLDEALRHEVGVSVLKYRGPVDNHSMTIMRGFQGQQRTLLMLDGIPLNSAITGSVPWGQMPVDEIDRVEVVRGPYSALYGGYALGGVINSIMKTPNEETIKARMGYGTFGTGNAHLTYGNRVLDDRLSFIVGFDRWWTDGYKVITVERPLAPLQGGEIPVTGAIPTTDVTGAARYTVGDTGNQVFNRDYYTGKLIYDLTPHSSISFTALHGEWTLDQPTFSTYLRDANGFPVISGNLDIDGNRVTLTERNFNPVTRVDEASLYALQYNADISTELTIKANLGYQSQFNSETEFRDVPTAFLEGELGFPTGTTAAWTTRDRDSSTIYAELLGTMQLGDRNLLTMGVLYEVAEGDQQIPVLRDRRVPIVIGIANRSGGEQNTQAIYLQDRLTLLDNLTVYLGGRYDRWENANGFQEAVDNTGASTLTLFEDRSQTTFNPKVSAVFSPTPSTNLRASVGTAFRPPTLDDLYVNSVHGSARTLGNPDLDPEEVTAWEVGFVQDLPTGTRIGVTYFQNEIENMIFRRAIGPDPDDATIDVRQLENANEAETKGVEFDLSHRFTPYLSLFANYTWLDAEITRYEANPALEGKTIPLIPEYLYNIGLDLNYGSFIGTVVYQGVGDAFGRDDNSDVVNGVRGGFDPYEVLDLKVTYTGWEKISASLAVNNVLDEEYSRSFGRSPGRTFYGELSVHF